MDLSVFIGYWTSAVNFLRSIEPASLLALPAPLHTVAIYISVRFALAVLAVVLFIVGTLLAELLLVLLRISARGADHERTGELARIYVEFEALLVAVGLVPAMVPQKESAGEAGQSGRPWSSMVSTRPRSASSVQHGAKRTLQGVTLLIYQLIMLVKSTLIFLTPTRPVRIIAWLLTIAYLGYLPYIIDFFGKMPIQNVTLPQVLTAVTLLVLLYVAIGSDVRGRAELNKNANYECRKTLHRCQPVMARAAEALSNIRRLSTDQLISYPTATAIERLTGRKDLEWRGSMLVPSGVSYSTLTLWWLDRRKNLRGVAPSAISPLSPRRLVNDVRRVKRNKASADLRKSFGEDVDKFISAVDELNESGFAFKLNHVLHFRYRRIFGYLHRHHLARGTAQASLLPDGQLFFADEPPNKAFATEHWSTLKGKDASAWSVLDACGLLSTGLRKVATEFGTCQWQLAIAEQYLHMLSRTVSRTLYPTVLERLRQAIGK